MIQRLFYLGENWNTNKMGMDGIKSEKGNVRNYSNSMFFNLYLWLDKDAYSGILSIDFRIVNVFHTKVKAKGNLLDRFGAIKAFIFTTRMDIWNSREDHKLHSSFYKKNISGTGILPLLHGTIDRFH